MIIFIKMFFDIKLIDIDYQWLDIFTKTLAEERFNFFKGHLGMVDLTNEVTK